MPLTPLSTPLSMEYKPLGLEAFAVPLSKLQEKFDLTQKQLDATDYTLNHLSADDERTDKVLGELNQTTKDLSQALVRTGNFREVASRLNKLNSFYNKNPELAAIKSNYTNYQEAWKEMDELRKNGDITPEFMKEWEYWAKNNFKGTNYNKETGTYNTGNFTPTGAIDTIRQEMVDEAKELAKMTEENKDAYIQRMIALGVTGDEADRLVKISLSEKNKDKVAYEINNVLSKIPKFAAALEREAEIKFFNNNNKFKKTASLTQEDPLKYSKDIVESYLPNLEARKEVLAAIASNENFSEKDRQEAEDDLKDVEKNMEYSISTLANAEDNPAALESLAESVFTADALGYISDLSSSTADLVDFMERDISGMGGAGSIDRETKKEIKEIGDIVTTVDEVTSTKGMKTEGSPSTYIQESLEDVGVTSLNDAFTLNETDMKNALATEAYEIHRDAWGGTYKKRVEDMYQYTELPDFYKNAANIKALDNFSKKYDEKIEEYEGEIVELNTQLSQVPANSAEYREISSKLVNLYNDKNQNILAKTKQLKDLDFNINELFTSLTNAGIGTEEFNFEKLQASLDKMATINGYNQYPGFVEELQERYNNNPEKVKKELAEISKLWKDNQGNSIKFLNDLQEISADNVVLSLELESTGKDDEIGVSFTNEMFTSTDPSSLIMRSIFDQFKTSKTLGSEGYIQIPKVNYTEGLNKYTSNVMGNIKDLVESNPNDFPRVNFDVKTRESSVAQRGQAGESYDLGVYSENPVIVGRDQNNNLILKYEKQPQYRKANQGTKRYFSDLKAGTITRDKKKDEEYVTRYTNNDIASFERNNPDELYITLEASNVDPILAAEKNYVRFVTEGLNSGDNSEGIEIIEQQRNNFAPLHLINNPDRALRYSTMAKTLTERAQKGIKSSEYQGPAFNQDNGDGSFTSYGIVYKTTTDNKIIAQVTKTTRIPSNEPGVPDQILEKVELPSTNITLGNNLPLTLLKMDMTFATGDEQDMITVRRNGYDVPFAIAFEQGSVFTNPETSTQAMDKIAN